MNIGGYELPKIGTFMNGLFTNNENGQQLLPIILSLNISQRDEYGNTILHHAARSKNTNKLQFITRIIDSEDRAIINIRNKMGYHAIHYAIAYSTPEIVRYLFSWGNIDVNVQQEITGFSPLHTAVIYKRHEIIKFLLRDCPNVDVKLIERTNQTPLKLAQRWNDWGAISLFEIYSSTQKTLTK